MEFNGFNVFSIGQAELSIENNLLRVSNISDSGLDGILIEQAGNCTVNFNNLPQLAEYNGVLSASTIKRNALGYVVTSVQAFTWYDEKIDRIVFGYNSSYLPRKYNVYGKLKGSLVFEIENSELKNKEVREPATIIAALSLIVAVANLAVSIWDKLRTKTTTTTTINTDKDGNITGYTETTSRDPDPFEIEVNGNLYIVDEVGIYYDIQYPKEYIGNPAIHYTQIAKEITGYKIPYFEISSIRKEE